MVYTRHVEYRFEVDGEEFAITPFKHQGQECLSIEETRKNGQEDCHMSGQLSKDGSGLWVWDEGRDDFEFYGDDDLPDAITEYLNQNPPPTE